MACEDIECWQSGDVRTHRFLFFGSGEETQRAQKEAAVRPFLAALWLAGEKREAKTESGPKSLLWGPPQSCRTRPRIQASAANRHEGHVEYAPLVGLENVYLSGPPVTELAFLSSPPPTLHRRLALASTLKKTTGFDLLPPPTASKHKGVKEMARGAATTPSSVFLSFALLLICFASGGMQSVQGQKTWCVAKPSSDEATLLGNINYACSQVDCSVLQRGRACFYPDNLMSHASIAMNLYYQSRGRNPWNCFFKNSGLLVATDPSYGSCAYA